MYVCACVRVCVCACVRMCVCTYVRARAPPPVLQNTSEFGARGQLRLLGVIEVLDSIILQVTSVALDLAQARGATLSVRQAEWMCTGA